MLKPSQLSAQLRRIAAAIDASKNPDKRLVTAAIRKTIAAIGWEGTPQDQVKKAMDGYVSVLKNEGSGPISRDWEEVRSLVMNPESIQRSAKWSGWSPEALQMLERNLDHLIGNQELYME